MHLCGAVRLCCWLIFHNGDFGHGCLAFLQNLFDLLQRCAGVDHLAALGAFQAGDVLDNDDAVFQFCHVGGVAGDHVAFAVKTIHAFFLSVHFPAVRSALPAKPPKS